MARGKYVTEAEAKNHNQAKNNKAAAAAAASNVNRKVKLEAVVVDEEKKKKKKSGAPAAAAAAAAAPSKQPKVAAVVNKGAKGKGAIKAKGEAIKQAKKKKVKTAEEKHEEALKARARQLAANLALADDDDDEEDEDFTEDPDAQADEDEEDESDKDGSDSDDDEFSDEVIAAELAAQRAPIAKRLALPAGVAEKPDTKKKKGGLTAAQKTAIRIRCMDVLAAREFSGLFGRKRRYVPRPSAFKALMSKFMDAAPRERATPRIQGFAILRMQGTLETLLRTEILPVAAEALLISQTCSVVSADTTNPAYANMTDDAVITEKTEAMRIEKKIMSRHMEYAARMFVRRVAPTLESVFDANMAIVNEEERKATVKRMARDSKVRHLLFLKTRIAELQRRDTAFRTEAKSPDNKPLTNEERAEWIKLTLEYEIACHDMAKRRALKARGAMAAAAHRIKVDLPAELSAASVAIDVIQDRIPQIQASIKQVKAEVARESEELIAWLKHNKPELEAAAVAAKRTDEQKALRKEALTMQRTLTSKRTYIGTLEKRLASQHSQIKKRLKSIEAKKAELPRLKEKITKNKIIAMEADAQVAELKKAIGRSRSVEHEEEKMDEE